MLTKKLMGAGGAGGAAGEAYWIALLGGTGFDLVSAVAVDSSDNIIVAGQTNSDGAGNQDVLIAKYNSSGTLQWDRTLGGTEYDRGLGVAVDGSDNIIVAGQRRVSNNDDGLIAKYNSSGTLQWHRTLGGSGGDYFNGVAVDSADNIICAGYTNSDGAGNYDGLIAKYNSSGTLQWDRTLGGSTADRFWNIAVDSADNYICVGETASDGAGGSDGIIAKYNSSGTLQWDRTLGDTSSDQFWGIAVDSSDNYICAGYGYLTTSWKGIIAKYNSSGTLQWDRTLSGSGTDRFYGVAVDSADNYICVGQTNSDGAGNYDGIIAKYNSSGTLQWDRTLGGTGADYFYGVAVDSSDNYICVGQTGSDGAGGSDLMTFRIISDGTLTGTYGAFVYEDAVLTDAAAGLTDAAAVLTDAAAVLTDAAAGLTDAEAVLTAELIEVS
jgi:uncharacterized delta-60 repeat protein